MRAEGGNNMSMLVSEHKHEFRTWAVYPRPCYFRKRFEDLFTRYKNITSNVPYPSLFQNKKLSTELEKLKSHLEDNLQVLVIGRTDLKTEDFVIVTDPVQQNDPQLQPQNSPTASDSEPEMTVVICHAKIDNYDSKGLQEVVDTVERFTSMQKNIGPSLPAVPFIVCQTNTTSGDDITEQFRVHILSTVENTLGLKLDQENVIMGLDGKTLNTKISSILEIKIVQGIIDMADHLQTFFSNNRRLAADTLDILESEQLVSTIQGFLRNGLAFVDMMENKGDEPFIETVLSRLATVVRCAVLTPISAKYGLLPDTCNIIAHELNFEDSLVKSISKNTRYHLSKLQQPCEDMVKATKSGDKWHRFPGEKFTFIAYSVRDDIKIKKPLHEFEDKIKTVRRTTNMMKQMLFEIKGCLKYSLVQSEESQPDKQPAISDMLRKAILATDGVYGMGTIYGEIQIHVDVEDGKMGTTQDAISETMELFQFSRPYHIIRILQLPQMLCKCETGKCLECKPNRRGTLGGFVYSNDNKQLYGLTSAHVVRGEHEVFITSESQERHLFGRIYPNMTVSGGNDGSLIDIAAVKVVDEFLDQCTVSLKDDDGNLKRSDLCTETPSELSGQIIYKYGAATNLTKGIICSIDYSVHDDETKDFLVLIDCLPGISDTDYALLGDSGAINCITDIYSLDTVKAVSMISSGGFMLEGNANRLCLSFLVRKGIEKLKKQCGVDLIFSCPDYSVEIYSRDMR